MHTDLRPPRPHPLVAAFLRRTAWVWGMCLVCQALHPAAAAYRCDGAPGEPPTYSQLPCGDSAQRVRTEDARTATQLREARLQQEAAEREARRYDRRMRREAHARRDEQPTAIDGPVRQVSPRSKQSDAGQARAASTEDDRHAGTVVRPKRVFKAKVPKEGGDVRYLVRP